MSYKSALIGELYSDKENVCVDDTKKSNVPVITYTYLESESESDDEEESYENPIDVICKNIMNTIKSMDKDIAEIKSIASGSVRSSPVNFRVSRNASYSPTINPRVIQAFNYDTDSSSNSTKWGDFELSDEE